MYDIIKNIIENGAFKVSDLTNKIDTLWAESKLSDDERSQLVQMMVDYLNPASEAPELKEMYERLEARVATLEEEVKKLKGEEPGGGEEGAVTVPAWEPESAGVDERYWKEITKEQAEGIISGDMTVDEVLAA